MITQMHIHHPPMLKWQRWGATSTVFRSNILIDSFCLRDLPCIFLHFIEASSSKLRLESTNALGPGGGVHWRCDLLRDRLLRYPAEGSLSIFATRLEAHARI